MGFKTSRMDVSTLGFSKCVGAMGLVCVAFSNRVWWRLECLFATKLAYWATIGKTCEQRGNSCNWGGRGGKAERHGGGLTWQWGGRGEAREWKRRKTPKGAIR